MMKKLIIILALALIFTMTYELRAMSCSYAAIPHLISYQGRLTDADGAVVADGTYSVTFRLYTSEAGGSPLWTEAHSVTATDGIFEVLMGSNASLDLPFDVQYYLGIQVGSDPEMTPRQRIASSGYAYNAETVSGIEVSTTPEAGKLLPLDENAQVPAEAIPEALTIKAWINFNGSGGASVRDSYNVSGVVRNAAGDYTITWSTPFATSGYAVIVSHKLNTPSQTHIASQTAGSVRIRVTQDGSSNSMDSDSVSVMAIGNQ